MLKKEYKALGLKEEASESQVKEAYNKKVQSILASKIKDSRMLKELKKIQSSYLKIINQQNDEVQNHPEEDLSLEGLKDTIKNSLNNLYISGTDIKNPKKRNEFRDDKQYWDYLKNYYKNSLPSIDKIEELFKNGNIQPRKRLDNETDEEYNIYIDEYYNRIMELRNETIKSENQPHIVADNQYIPGTTILKPKDRYDIEQEGIYDSYEEYLAEYYKKVFNRDDKDEKIPGRQINMPRDRKLNETEEQYQAFLEKYYKENVVPVPKMAYSQGKKHKVIATRENQKHKYYMKVFTAITLIVIGIASFLGIRSSKHKSGSMDNRYQKGIERSVEDVSTTGENLQQEIQRDVDQILNKGRKVSTPTIADTIHLKQGTKYYYDAQKSKPTGTIGNKFSPTSSKYKVDGIALINKKDNSLIKARFGNKLSAKKMMKIYGVEKDDCRVMYHISRNHKTGEKLSNQRGWIEFHKNNYQLNKNGKGKSTEKQKVKK